MRPRHRLAIAFLITTAVVVAAGWRWLDPEPAVYAAATDALRDAKIAVASAPSLCGTGAENFEGVSLNLIAAFRDANARGAALGNVSGLRDHFAIANSRQLAALEAQGLDEKVAGTERLPVLRLSRVGFSTDGLEALMCVRAQHGSAVVHLRKISGSWQVESQQEIQVAR